MSNLRYFLSKKDHITRLFSSQRRIKNLICPGKKYVPSQKGYLHHSTGFQFFVFGFSPFKFKIHNYLSEKDVSHHQKVTFIPAQNSNLRLLLGFSPTLVVCWSIHPQFSFFFLFFSLILICKSNPGRLLVHPFCFLFLLLLFQYENWTLAVSLSIHSPSIFFFFYFNIKIKHWPSGGPSI